MAYLALNVHNITSIGACIILLTLVQVQPVWRSKGTTFYFWKYSLLFDELVEINITVHLLNNIKFKFMSPYPHNLWFVREEIIKEDGRWTWTLGWCSNT